MFIAYMNSTATGIAFAHANLLVVYRFMKKYGGFYLIKREGQNIGIYTPQAGLTIRPEVEL